MIQRISSARRVYWRYNDGDLSFEDFYQLSQMNCYYCNICPSNIADSKNSTTSKYYADNSKFKYNGLDRVNNSLNHTKLNSRSCCKRCNISKREQSLDEFFSWVIRLINGLICFNKEFRLWAQNNKDQINNTYYNLFKLNQQIQPLIIYENNNHLI